MREEGIRPIAASKPGAKRRAHWSLAEGSPVVRVQAELPQLRDFDARNAAHSDAILRASGHTDPSIRETRRGAWKFTCGCGYEAPGRASKPAAVDAATEHLTRAIRRVVSRAKQSGISLAAAAEFERSRNSGVSNSDDLRPAG